VKFCIQPKTNARLFYLIVMVKKSEKKGAKPRPEGTHNPTTGKSDEQKTAHGFATCGEWFKTVINASKDAMIAVDEQGLIRLFNPAAEKMFGVSASEMLDRPLDPIMPEGYREEHREFVRGYFAEGRPCAAIGNTLELPALRSDGEQFPMELSLSSGQAEDRRFVVAVIRDITERKKIHGQLEQARDEFEARVEERTRDLSRVNEKLVREIEERKRAEAALLDQDSLLRGILHSLTAHIVVLDRNAEIMAANEAWRGFIRENMFLEGVSVGVGDNYLDLCANFYPPDEASEMIDGVRSVLRGEKQAFSMEFSMNLGAQVRWFTKVVTPLDIKTGGAVVSVIDITNRKQAEEQLLYQAFHDPLTGLPNRSLLMDRLSQAIERARRRDDYFYAVLFLDVDRFKMVNDTMGHSVGDKLLKAVGRRLEACLRRLDTVARLGGDEFVVLLEEITSPREVIRIVKRMREDMREAFIIDGQEVYVSASIGILLSPVDYLSADELLRDADIAMHWAKGKGRDKFKVFNPRLRDQALEAMNLENDLRRALKKHEFFLVFQPIMSLSSGTVTGFEALLRWNHPSRGIILPMSFIPLAEDNGLIVPIGYWVIKTACETMVRWREKNHGARDLYVSVNISARQFAETDLFENIHSMLKQSGLPPQALKLELTETVIMENPEMAKAALRRLKNLGVKISIDDFGSGYSSLNYLQQFPIDTLKVDRTFINRLVTDKENQAIVQAIIALAHNLGMDVVAEGVELSEHSSYLSTVECDFAQGFLFARPMDIKATEKFLAEYLVNKPESDA